MILVEVVSTMALKYNYLNWLTRKSIYIIDILMHMKDYLTINEAAYDIAASEYADRVEEYQDSDVVLIAPFINYLRSEFSNVHVLELGPGSGLALRMFEDEGFSSTAIDISANIINIARTNAPHTEFIKADFLAHNFADNQYSGIFAKAFIHLFPKNDAIEILGKIYALLAPKGALFLATTIHDEPKEGYEEKTDYEKSPVRFRKKWTETELLEALGDKWNIIEKSYNNERGKSWLALTLSKI